MRSSKVFVTTVMRKGNVVTVQTLNRDLAFAFRKYRRTRLDNHLARRKLAATERAIHDDVASYESPHVSIALED